MTGSDKAFYQPWNEEEFQSDLFVRKMNQSEKWMYRALLQAMFFHSTRPYLPNDDSILWMLADCDTYEFWMSNKTKVVSRFEHELVDGQEVLAHGRVMRDWQRLVDKREALAERGRSGGLAKAKRQPAKEVKQVSKEREVSKGQEDSPLSLEQFADRVVA